ncbi:alpha/beta hydrolase [Streptomyces sp. NPDC096068]|uniref:alpha/beta hydrolase family protein n=1 Tax=Streptomyces sp. NPDC096068 TaxID=3155424 RepID=UPI00331CD84B
MPSFAQNLFVTWSALTRTTERGARRRGVGRFLPALFVDRFASLGGIDKAVFTRRLDGCRTFRDQDWAAYWRRIADSHLAGADQALAALGAPSVQALMDSDDTIASLGTALAPAATVLADRTPENGPTLVVEFCRRHPEHRAAATAVDELVKGMTYLFVAAWPGWTPQRLAAYDDSQRIFHVLLMALAPALDLHVERIRLDIDGEQAVAYAVFAAAAGRQPTVLITNGLEGTVQEGLLPVLKHRDRGVALVVMEMPGTFQYTRRLSVETEHAYRAVIDQLCDHPRIDADRLGMLGLSFGAHWSTRMAARDPRLKAVVSNGGPYHHSFGLTGVFGMPEIMLWTLKKTTGAKSLAGLGRRLKSFDIKRLYGEIAVPLLVINGDSDTLISTQDSIDLAEAAPHGELMLYPDDDHCAMGHYSAWLELATHWIAEHLQGVSSGSSR